MRDGSNSSHSDMEPLLSDIALRYRFARRLLPSGDTASPRAFTRLERWIATCTSSHDRCNEASNLNYMPKRLLELAHGKVFLREHLPPRIRYASLSHCWGPDGVSIKLLSDALPAFKEGVRQTDLPKTFREAIQICLQLDITYLWIDALCTLRA